jgi:O-antigen/teichoic acid export membrane protein
MRVDFLLQKLIRRLVGEERTADGFSRTLIDLLGDSTQYLFGLVVMGLTNTILLPLYMRYLGPRDFGLYALLEVTTLGLMIVSGLGFNVSYLKSFSQSEERGVPTLLGTMLIAGGVSAASGGLALAVFMRSAFGSRIFGQGAARFAGLLTLMVLFETLETLFHTHLRAQRRPTAISVASVLRLLGVAVFSILFIAIQHRGLIGLFGGRVVGDVVALVANIVCCRRDVAINFSRRAMANMLRYGLPLVTIGLIQLGLDGTGRYLVDHFGTLEQVGLYTAGIKISNLMRILLVAPLGAAWGGMLFQIGKQRNAQFIYSKLFSYIFFTSAVVAIALALLTPTLFVIFTGPSYRGATTLVPWLLLVQVASILQCPASVGIYLGNATGWLFPIYAVGLAVEIGIGRILVPRYGMFGAAWAWLLGWLLISILTAWIGQRYYRLHFEWRSICLSLLILAAIPTTRYLRIAEPTVVSVLSEFGGSCLIVAVAGVWIVRDVKKSRALFGGDFARNGLSELIQEAELTTG